MAEVFVVGAWAFWALLIIEGLILLGAVAADDSGGPVAVITFLLTLAILQTWSDFKPFTVARAEPVSVFLMAAAYLAIGAAWSVFKWWRLEVESYSEAKRSFLVTHNLTDITPEWNEKWASHKSKHRDSHYFGRRKVGRWIGLWPFSMFATICGDWLLRAVENIAYYLEGTYDRISEMVWSK